DLGWSVEAPKATFYVWSEIPEPGVSSMEFAERLIDVGVVGTPGVGFGASGEGYIRFALTQPSERIKEAIERLSKL
ncbi:MAG: aminotransferase class I/II-fold pyridoxal phosphate-dependent enzyme, partial [Promethearchaeota archaeon]